MGKGGEERALLTSHYGAGRRVARTVTPRRARGNVVQRVGMVFKCCHNCVNGGVSMRRVRPIDIQCTMESVIIYRLPL